VKIPDPEQQQLFTCKLHLLSYMNPYVLWLFYYSSTIHQKAILFLFGRTTTDILLGPKMRNSIKCVSQRPMLFPKDTTMDYRSGNRTKISESFDY